MNVPKNEFIARILKERRIRENRKKDEYLSYLYYRNCRTVKQRKKMNK